jgi:hypothetical protein
MDDEGDLEEGCMDGVKVLWEDYWQQGKARKEREAYIGSS